MLRAGNASSAPVHGLSRPGCLRTHNRSIQHIFCRLLEKERNLPSPGQLNKRNEEQSKPYKKLPSPTDWPQTSTQEPPFGKQQVRSPSDPHLTRANPFPKVTGPFCRLPLPALFILSRGCSPWGPDAVIGTSQHEIEYSPPKAMRMWRHQHKMLDSTTLQSPGEKNRGRIFKGRQRRAGRRI